MKKKKKTSFLKEAKQTLDTQRNSGNESLKSAKSYVLAKSKTLVKCTTKNNKNLKYQNSNWLLKVAKG